MKWILVFLVALGGTVLADAKYGKQVRFAGIHPIPKGDGGGICYIEGPHVHLYAADKLEFRVHGPDAVFVGDPVAYGYDGPRVTYDGPHAVHLGGDTVYCYLKGPHFHAFAPPDGPDFEKRGEVYFYVAPPPPVFVKEHPIYASINARYQPIVYERPTVIVEPPAAWIGAHVDVVAPVVVAPVVEAPHVEVIAPRVVVPSVEIRVPTIEIGGSIGVGVGVGGGHHRGRHR